MKQIFDWLREQMDKEYNHYMRMADYTEDEELRAFKHGVSKGLDMAHGFINEAEAKWEADCCEWKLEDAEANLYVTSCEQRHLIFEDTPRENGYKYCPYCGRKIVEVE